jgi:deoxyadenosine/deoxycytidine kinase
MANNIHKIISIEGNIGCGKSTLLNIIKSHIINTNSNTNSNNMTQLIDEPVDQWISFRDSQNENILEKFYKNKQKWGSLFQMHAFLTRIKETTKTIINSKDKGGSFLCERSIMSDKNIFSAILQNSGDMTEMETMIYNEWFTWIVSLTNTEPSKFIYMRADPDICYQRIKKRNRKEENDIKREYIENIHDLHETWLNTDDANILIINANDDFINNSNNKKEIINKVMKFISC